MALGVQNLPAIYNPMQGMTLMKPPTPSGGGAVAQAMSPMDSMREIFLEMRDGINRIADNVSALVDALAPNARDTGITGADTGRKPDKNKDGGFKGMLSSLKGIFGKLDPRNMGGLMKTFLLMSGLALLFKYSDLIEKALAPVLEKAKAFTDMLGPKGSLYLGLAALGALLFPGTFMAVLKAAKLVVIDGLPLAVSGIGTAFRSMKGFLTDTLPGAIKGTYTFGKGLLLKSVALVTGAFKAMKVFLVEKLIPGIYAGFGRVGSATRKLWTKGLVLLKASFASLRLFLVGSLVPAIGSILIPFLPVIAVIAGAVLVITSIYNAFQDFKTALDEGATIGTALAEFGASFLANILALPLDWMKNAVAWVAGILGFEGIKETLDSFSFVDLLKDSFKFLFQKVADFITAMFDFDFSAFFASVGNIASRIAGTLEAVAKGAVAALAAALPGGVTPQEAFKKKFDEVMAGNVEDDEVSKIDAGANAPGEEMATADVYRSAREYLYGEGGKYTQAEWNALASKGKKHQLDLAAQMVRSGEIPLIPEKIETQQDTNQLIEQSQAMKDLRAKQEMHKAHGRMNMPITNIQTDNSVKDESTQIVPLQQENDDYTQRALMSYATRYSGLGRGLIGF